MYLRNRGAGRASISVSKKGFSATLIADFPTEQGGLLGWGSSLTIRRPRSLRFNRNAATALVLPGFSRRRDTSRHSGRNASVGATRPRIGGKEQRRVWTSRFRRCPAHGLGPPGERQAQLFMLRTDSQGDVPQGLPSVTVAHGEAASSERPASPVIRGERKVIVIFTDTALIHRISADRRRIKIFQHDISAVATNEIVAACA